MGGSADVTYQPFFATLDGVGETEDGFYIFSTKSSAVFKPAENKWTVFPMHDSSSPRSRGATVAIGNKVYLLGGLVGNTLSDRVDVFDASARKFARGTPMTSPRCDHAGAGYAGKLYVFGGSVKINNAITTVEMFDPGSGKWSAMAPMPHAWSEMSTGPMPVYANGVVMIPHSYRNDKAYLGSLEYDTTNDEWAEGPKMVRPVGRYTPLYGSLEAP
jgi:N-acetylneuraminic acid mutarotase